MTRRTLPQLLAATALVAGLGQTAAAQDCATQVANIMTDALEVTPSRGLVVTRAPGRPESVRELLIVSRDHMLSKPTEAENAPWIMTYSGMRYMSTDAGESWEEFEAYDAQADRSKQIATVEMQIAGIVSAECGQEMMEGTTFNTYSAEIVYPAPADIEITATFWVNPSSGHVRKSATIMESQGQTNEVIQTWEREPSLTLPVPTL